MGKKYYFLGSALPLLSLRVKSDVTYAELLSLMEWNLTEKDKGIVRIFKAYIDLKNLKQLWLREPLDHRGNLNEKSLNEALFSKDGLPEFVFEFIEKFASDEDRIKNFPYLLVRFFEEEKKGRKSDFLDFYFGLEHRIILITTALRAKKTNKDLPEEFSYEDKLDFLVKKLIDQGAASHLEMGKEQMEIADLFENHYKEPKKLYLAFLEYRFQKIAEEAEKKPFSIDQIVGYLAGIMLIEDYFRLNEGVGKKILDGLLR
jgi:hypothetical protein